MPSEALTALQTEVAELTTVNESAITLLKGLAEKIRNSAGSTEEILAIATELDTKTNALAAAVTENTPAE